jgi:hypothetical protein
MRNCEMLNMVEPRHPAQERMDLAERILTCALHLSGLERGVIALWMPQVRGKTRFRIARMRGFEQAAAPVLVELLSRAVRRPTPKAIRGHCFAYTSGGQRHYVGGGGMFPLVAEGRVIGAIVLDRPDRSRPLGTFEAKQVMEFIGQGARLLAETLPAPGRRAG